MCVSQLRGPSRPAAGRRALPWLSQMCSVIQRHKQPRALRPPPPSALLRSLCQCPQCDDSSYGRFQAASVRSLSAEPGGPAHSQPRGLVGACPSPHPWAHIHVSLLPSPKPAAWLRVGREPVLRHAIRLAALTCRGPPRTQRGPDPQFRCQGRSPVLTPAACAGLSFPACEVLTSSPWR